MTTGPSEIPAQAIAVQGEEMLQPDEVTAMVRLHELGWGAKRLSKEFGCARNTVRRYLRAGGVVPFARAAAAHDGSERRGAVFCQLAGCDCECGDSRAVVDGLPHAQLGEQRVERDSTPHRRRHPRRFSSALFLSATTTASATRNAIARHFASALSITAITHPPAFFI